MKHHFATWETGRDTLQGLARAAVMDGDAHSHCARCKVFVKIARGQHPRGGHKQ